jgi:hypothetical protein
MNNFFSSEQLLYECVLIPVNILFTHSEDEIIGNGRFCHAFGIHTFDYDKQLSTLKELKKSIVESGALEHILQKTFVEKTLLPRSNSGYNSSDYIDLNVLYFGIFANMIHEGKHKDYDSFKPQIKMFEERFQKTIETNQKRGRTYYRKEVELEIYCEVMVGVFSDSFDARKIFKQRFIEQKYGGSHPSRFDTILLLEISKIVPEEIISFMESAEFKKCSWHVRSLFFNVIAESGNMTQKIARRLRSESSEIASRDGVRVLVKNIEKLKNPASILSQLADSNYESVSLSLASSIPIDYLLFLAGSSSGNVRNEVARRLDEYNSKQGT